VWADTVSERGLLAMLRASTGGGVEHNDACYFCAPFLRQWLREARTEELTPVEWQALLGVEIQDPDGWRSPDAPPWDQPITRVDFMRRMGVSTIRRWPNFSRIDW
jgi:hypothetical protein